MATINIGSLTFTHKGDYASGTAYVKNDVVYYSTNGNAYIAKQATQGNAPTNATYWSQFTQGTGGIWNAGLSLGSASQKLRVNSGGNALEFFTEPAVTSDYVLISSPSDSNATTHNFSDVFTDTYHTYRATFSQWCSGSQPRLRFLTTGTTQLNSAIYDSTGNESGTNTSGSTYENQLTAYNTNHIRIHSDNAGESTSSRHYFDITFRNMRVSADQPHIVWTHWGYSGSDWIEGGTSGGRYRSSTTVGGFHLYNQNSASQYIYDMKIYGIKG